MSNAPRYRLVGYDIGTAPDENGGWVHWTDHEAIVARLTAERDVALAGAVKVKPLVWAAHSRGVLTARTAFGTGYSVADSQWNYGPTMVWFHAERGDEAAKAAAQADYAARILAAIQPDPEASQAALAKAFCMGLDAAAAWHTMQAETAMGALCCGSDNYEIRRAGRVSDMHRGHSEAIRSLQPPADLAAKQVDMVASPLQTAIPATDKAP